MKTLHSTGTWSIKNRKYHTKNYIYNSDAVNEENIQFYWILFEENLILQVYTIPFCNKVKITFDYIENSI